MRCYYKPILSLWIVSLFVGRSFAQDVGFSQFYDQPLLRNPALAGIFTGDVRFTAFYRDQWQSITIPYRTFGLSSEVKLPVNIVPDDNLTIGIQLLKDVAGTSEFSATQFLPAINYSLPVSGTTNAYLSLAFMGGLMQQQFDPLKLVLNDQFVSSSNGSFSILPYSRQLFTNTNVTYLDLSAGLSYNSTIGDDIDYYVGLGMFHITNPEVGFFEGNKIVLNKKLAFNVGISVPVSETDQLILYGDYFKRFRKIFPPDPTGASTLQMGMLYRHDLYVLGNEQQSITFGLLCRWNDAAIPIVQLQLSKFIIGTSYDVNISKLVAASSYRGGFELTISFRDFLNTNKKEQRQSKCPRFGRDILKDFIGY